MEDILCFRIEGRSLYLDHVLVDFDGTPLFFVCKDETDYYLVLCYDTDRFEYYVAMCGLDEIKHMICGEIPMAAPMLSSKKVWRVVTSEEFDDDIVRFIGADGLDRSALPGDDAFYEIVDEDVRGYLDDLKRRKGTPYVNMLQEIKKAGADGRIEDIMFSNISISCRISKADMDAQYFEELKSAFENMVERSDIRSDAGAEYSNRSKQMEAA